MRLPRVLRALRPEPARERDPRANLRVTFGDDPHRAVYGREQTDWHPPTPHAATTVTLGSDPRAARDPRDETAADYLRRILGQT